jgi:enterochelin esterase-like enzyme
MLTITRRSAAAFVIATGFASLCDATPRVASLSPTQIEPAVRVSAGKLERYASFPSKYVAPRTVEVWLPPNYSAARRYAVLYMHDGQMLFDPATTWNQQAWNIDDVAAPLIASGKVREFIVVAPWNSGRTRHAEFFPQKFLTYLQPKELRDQFVNDALLGAPLSDAYLKFLVDELKPFIDQRYATRPERESTFLLGSSMGGLISLYALLEYPDVFGGAAALSTHWIGTFERNANLPAAALGYMREKLPPPGRHKIYMDRGTIDLDAKYDESQPLVDALMAERGFSAPLFETRLFENASHTERDWSLRLDVPLQFLLGAKP